MASRVFIGLTEVSGYFGNLQRGLEGHGVTTTYLDLSGHPFGYRRAGLVGTWGGLSISLALRAARAQGLARGLWRAAWMVTYLLQMPVRVSLLASAIRRHDVFILSSDTWVHRSLDLPLLRLMGKRIVVVFTGSDHRPPYLDGWFGVGSADTDYGALARSTRKVRSRVLMAERYADEIVALPASAHFHTRPIVDFLRVGIPSALLDASGEGGPSPFRGEGVRVLHSASNAVGKGTDLVRAAIGELKAAGLAIDYHEILRRPHSEVLNALQYCDFVVDEVFSDTPMAAFAAEAAAMGKPAVVTGYYAEMSADRRAESVPPSLFEPPDRLRGAIERLVRDETFRRELGDRARAFVLENWTPAAVAGRYLRIIDGSVPEDWRWDPAAQRYLYGWGMDRQRVASVIRELIAREGSGALGLGHNADLQARILEIANA